MRYSEQCPYRGLVFIEDKGRFHCRHYIQHEYKAIKAKEYGGRAENA